MLNRSRPQGARAYAAPPLHSEGARHAGVPRYALPRKEDVAVPRWTYAWVVAFSVLLAAGTYLAVFSYVHGLIAGLP